VFRVNPGFEQEWPGASAGATEVVLNVIRAGDALAARVDELARQHGLPSSTSVIVLEVLRGAGEPLQPSEVARRCFLSRPALSSVMQTLEKRGQLTRAVHTEDRRRVRVEITPAGRAALERLLPELHRAEAEWISRVAEAERETLLRLISSVHAGLEDVPVS
jgi:DNA-binding MarR family transcriptional regulator